MRLVMNSPTQPLGPSDHHSDHRTQSDVLRTSYSVQDRPILLLVTSQDWGGVQAFLFDLALEMKNRGLPVKVCAGPSKTKSPRHPELVSGSETNSFEMPNQVRHDDATNGSELGSKCRGAGIEFIELRHMARDINPWTNFLSLIELVKLFRREKPQAVHLNSTMMGVVGSLAARLTSVPWHGRSRNDVPWTVYCIGGWVFNEQLPGWKKKFYILIEKISARWKDVIACVHPGDERLARDLKIKPRHLLTTVPNGIDVEAFENQLLDHNEARSALYERGTTPEAGTALYVVRGTVVGTVANAYPPKNLIWYLDVCKTVHDQNPDIRFVIIGDGPLMDDLRHRHAELKQDDYVMLAGRRMDAKKLYRAFDMFVLPSTKEGMSITLLEAMAAHVPIVATDVGANRWMLGKDAGIVVPPNDKQALANAVLSLNNDANLRQKISAKAYQEAIERFTWKQTVEGTLKTLNTPSCRT